MRLVTLAILATAATSLFLFCCKKSPEPCWDTCPFPRKCYTYDCSCPDEMFFYDSLFIFRLPPAGTGPVVDGWPTLNDKKFLFYFHGIIKHENRDTLYARLRWIGLGSGEDLREPVDFNMHIPKRD